MFKQFSTSKMCCNRSKYGNASNLNTHISSFYSGAGIDNEKQASSRLCGMSGGVLPGLVIYTNSGTAHSAVELHDHLKSYLRPGHVLHVEQLT